LGLPVKASDSLIRKGVLAEAVSRYLLASFVLSTAAPLKVRKQVRIRASSDKLYVGTRRVREIQFS
jgi:hypothetical protein